MPRDTSPVHGNIFVAPDIDSRLAHQLLDTPAQRVIAEGRRGRLEEVPRAANIGRLARVAYGEGFTAERLIAVDTLDKLK